MTSTRISKIRLTLYSLATDAYNCVPQKESVRCVPVLFLENFRNSQRHSDILAVSDGCRMVPKVTRKRYKLNGTRKTAKYPVTFDENSTRRRRQKQSCAPHICMRVHKTVTLPVAVPRNVIKAVRIFSAPPYKYDRPIESSSYHFRLSAIQLSAVRFDQIDWQARRASVGS